MSKVAGIPWSPKDAQKLIAELAMDRANVRITDECSTGEWSATVTIRQIFKCLEDGEILGRPHFNPETSYWECRMGRFVAGQDIVVNVAVSPDKDHMFVINVCEQ